MRQLVLIVAILIAAVGCANGSSSSNTSLPLPAPEGDAFYAPPDPLPAGMPGDLIWARPMTPLAPASRAWQVLYLSESVNGAPIAVSGLVAVPDGAPPPGGWDMVAWAHGTKGVNDPCTPSKGFRISSQDIYDLAPMLLGEGYAVVATDYEGLGTPGIHPYLVGESEARGVLDIARAAAQVDGVATTGRLVVWGRSQGGHAALFTGEIAPVWAPELDLLGVLAAAPASNLESVSAFGPLLPNAAGFLWLMTLAFEAVYDLPVDAVFTPDALAAVRGTVEDDLCGRDTGDLAAPFPLAGFATNPLYVEGWAERLRANSPARVRSEAPVLIIQGTEDVIVPKVLTDVLVLQLEARGTAHEYRVYPGEGHNDSTALHVPEALEGIAARFSGEPVSREWSKGKGRRERGRRAK